MAVGHERTHAQLVGQTQGLLVGGCRLHDIGGDGVGLDGAELVQRVGLIPACLVLPGQVERLAGVLPGLLAGPASRQTSLSQATLPARLASPPVRIASLIASSSSARPSARRPWSA